MSARLVSSEAALLFAPGAILGFLLVLVCILISSNKDTSRVGLGPTIRIFPGGSDGKQVKSLSRV